MLEDAADEAESLRTITGRFAPSSIGAELYVVRYTGKSFEADAHASLALPNAVERCRRKALLSPQRSRGRAGAAHVHTRCAGRAASGAESMSVRAACFAAGVSDPTIHLRDSHSPVSQPDASARTPPPPPPPFNPTHTHKQHSRTRARARTRTDAHTQPSSARAARMLSGPASTIIRTPARSSAR